MEGTLEDGQITVSVGVSRPLAETLRPLAKTFRHHCKKPRPSVTMMLVFLEDFVRGAIAQLANEDPDEMRNPGYSDVVFVMVLALARQVMPELQWKGHPPTTWTPVYELILSILQSARQGAIQTAEEIARTQAT